MASTIPKGSTVLVTGINGFLGSNVADQLLLAGYKVRGTTRDIKKTTGLVALWEEKYGKGQVEIVIVKNMADPGAFDEAVKGVAGIAHVASNVSQSPDANAVISESLAGIRSILDSAISSPSVTRFVYTSSGSAASQIPLHNTDIEFTVDSWNDKAVEMAWAPPPHSEAHGFFVYCASKVEAEKLVFSYAKEKNAAFNVATILPAIILGKVLDRNIPSNSGDLVKSILDGQPTPLTPILPYWFVDVQDTARLHVAALINPEVTTERIFAYAKSFDVNELMSTLRKIHPDKNIPDIPADGKKDLTRYPTERGAELLRAMGRPGWTSFEETIRLNTEGL